LACERHGIGSHQVQFDLSQPYPVRPYTLQANETDWDFVQRLATHAGLYSYSIAQDNSEVIIFTDHNAHCPYITRNVLSYIPETGTARSLLGQSLVGIYDLSVNVRAVTPQVRIHDLNEETPTTKLLAGTSVGDQTLSALTESPQPGETTFGLGTRTLDDSARWSKRQTEAAKVHAFDLTARGNVVDMAAGHVCSLDTALFDPRYAGDYLITRVTHRASQHSGANLDSAELAYRHDATCIKRETPYRPVLMPHPPLPMTLSARIESDGPYARLDEQGKYQVRSLFDLSSTRHTQASIPLRRLSPYGGLPNQSNVGLHTPLQDGAEVLISCLNGDPDRPMIVGTVPNPDTVSPVTSKNPSQNRLRTQSDNELCLDDTKEKEAITLRTYSGFNILHLDATAMAHKVRLATQHGAMSTWAKKTILRQSDDSMTELVGNDRNVIVENMHRTETKTKEIHHQAATDHVHGAYQNYRTDSGKNTELQTGRNMILDVADNTTLTIKGSGGLFATIHNNAVFLQSAKAITIQGQGGGDITFEQSGGGFKVDAGGNVKLYGNKVFVGGSGGVSLNGNVNYSVPGPQPPGAVNTTSPLSFAGIDALIDPREPQVIDLAWAQDRIPVGEIIQGMFTAKNFTGSETATINIYEYDANGQNDLVDTLTVPLDQGNTGQYTFDWRRTAQQADQDQQNDAAASDIGPLEYRFDVDINGTLSDKPSSYLWLTKTIEITVEEDEEGFTLPDGTELEVIDADNKRQYATLKNGVAHFKDVLIGKIQLNVTTGTDT
jgi:type VI secretion system secreted protein VgrG